LSTAQSDPALHAKLHRRRFILILEIVTVVIALVCLENYVDLLGLLAEVSYHFGHPVAAEVLFKQSLFVEEKTVGANSEAVIGTLNAMAYFYYDTDQIGKAVPVAERNLSICQAKFSPDDPRLAWTLSMTSLIYDGSGKYTEAERMARTALPVLESAYGKQNWSVATTLNRLGLALEGQGRYPEAEEALLRALHIREIIFGQNSESLLPILNNLSYVYAEEGKKQEAGEVRRRAADISAHRTTR
jgi:tetratricopeptide (TPR) repeat protein